MSLEGLDSLGALGAELANFELNSILTKTGAGGCTHNISVIRSII